MTDVSTWNAVDASNSATPPDGWPEGQMPASVNDCGRMMMGALRREHDLITAKIGSTPGAISTTTINATTVTTTGNASVGGHLTASNGVSAPYLNGGVGNAGVLGAYGSSDNVLFRWDGAYLFYRINNAGETSIATGAAYGLHYAAGGGSPSGVILYGSDGFASMGINCDYAVSDARLKENIEPTGIDALDVLQQVPVSRFDIGAAAAAWLAATGTAGKERAEILKQATEPLHVPIGFVAQDLMQLVPEAVAVIPQPAGTPFPADLHTVSQQNLIPYLVRAIQQLAARVEELEARSL